MDYSLPGRKLKQRLAASFRSAERPNRLDRHAVLCRKPNRLAAELGLGRDNGRGDLVKLKFVDDGHGVVDDEQTVYGQRTIALTMAERAEGLAGTNGLAL